MNKWFVLRLRRSVLVISSCVALGAGLVLGRFCIVHSFWWVWGFVPFLVLAMRRHGIATLLLLVIVFFGVGWWRGSDFAQKLSIYTTLQKQKVVVVGRATEDGVYGQNSQMVFGMDNLHVIWPRDIHLIGSIGVKGFGVPSINRGDIVKVSGSVFLTRGNNLASIGYSSLQIVQSRPSVLEGIRHRFVAGIQSALPEPEASFGLGLLVGQRSTLPADLTQQIMMVGLTHVIAVSGYNLTIIVEVTRRLFGKLSKFQNTALCLALTGLFLLITGSSPSIVRASIISVLSITAWYYGRSIKPFVLLAVSATISALANPLYLWGNVSWYLSFLAFTGVLVVGPLLTQRFFGGKKPSLFIAVLIESLCASIMTIPYILYIFGQVSLVALAANLLVVPLIPFAMLVTLVSGVAGMLVAPVAGWLAVPARIVLTYMLDVCALLSRVPHAFIQNVTLPAWMMLFIYSCVAAMCWLLWQKNAKITDKNIL